MPEPQSETSVVEREIRIEAEPETVFAFFTDPEKMVRWMGIGATLDPRPGGVFSVNTMTDHFFGASTWRSSLPVASSSRGDMEISPARNPSPPGRAPWRSSSCPTARRRSFA